MKKTQKHTGGGSSDSTGPTLQTLKKSGSESVSLEDEAKAFRQRKKVTKPKPMTSRIYLMGAALTGLLARQQGPMRREEIKREAREWADYLLSDDD